MTDSVCHYEVLGVARDASDDVIRRSFKKLVLYWHPDKNPDNREEATEMFRLISEAYAILGDPDQRRKYDRDTRQAAEKRGGKPAATPAKTARPGPPRPAAATPARPDPPEPSAPPAPDEAPEEGLSGWGDGVSTAGRQTRPRHVDPTAPQPELGGWNGGGMTFEGPPVGGNGAGWPHPYHQVPPGFQTHPFQQPAPYAMFPQDNAFYGQQGQPFQSPAGPFPQPYVQQGPHFQQHPYQQHHGGYSFQGQHSPFQQQQQQQQQVYCSPVPPSPAQWDTYYGGYGGVPTSCPPPTISVTSTPSTELTLAHSSPPMAPQRPPFDQGYPPSFGLGGAPPYALPQAAPMATAVREWEPESDASDSDEPPSPSSTHRSGGLSIFRRRGSQAKPPYPTETRYIPPPPPEFLNPSYPKETRVATTEGQQHPRVRSARMVLALGLTASAPTPGSCVPAPSPPTAELSRAPAPVPVPQQQAGRADSVDSFVGGRSSRGTGSDRGGGLFGGGGLLAQMFAGALGGMLTPGGSADGDDRSSGSRQGGGSRKSFSGPNGGGGTGNERVSSRTSRRMSIGADGNRTYFFSRTERTVVNPDGTRNTQVEEVVDDRRRGARSGVSVASLDSPRRS